MAVTNGWGQGVINNTNGFGKLATNNIGAGSIYEDSYSGDTDLIGTSAAFSYSAASFTQADSNPTPTITGTTGGTFSGTSGLVFVSTSTGEIDLSASTIAAHVVTYTVGGVSSTFNLSVVSAPYASTSSFSFDGVNDYFDLGNNNFGIDYNTTFSISAWVNPAATGTLEIFSKRLGVNPYTGYELRLQLSNQITLIIDDGANFISTLTTSGIGTGSWKHIVATYDGTGNKNGINIYVDGGIVASTDTGTTITSTISNSAPAQIGARSGALFFNGKMDEVSIWDSALSSAAITEIAAGPNDLTSLTNASSSNLKAWYKMGE
jgi:hypothetical protein